MCATPSGWRTCYATAWCAADWLEVIADCFAREPRVGLVGGNCLPPKLRGVHLSVCPATRVIDCVYDPAALGFVALPGFYFGGANIAVRHDTLEGSWPKEVPRNAG
jgi:hypothetical protein